MRNFILIALLCSLSASLAAAEKVYKSTNKEGVVEYSDKPVGRNAELIKVPKGSTYSAPPLPNAAADDGAADPEPKTATQYESLAIASPSDEQSIRSNPGKLTARAKTVPATIASTDRLSWKLDGQTVEGANAPTLNMNNVPRGSHTLQVEIVDQAGKVLITSDTTTFYMIRFVIPKDQRKNLPPAGGGAR